MKVKVVKQFIDKNTNLLHKVNNEIEITKERFHEINGTSFGVFVKEIVEKKTETKHSPGTNPPTKKKSPGAPNKKKSTKK